MKRYSNSDKQNYVTQYYESKLSINEFCRINNLSPKTFYNWVKKANNKQISGEFVPVGVFKEEIKAVSDSSKLLKLIMIELPNGVTINVPL
jgi:transposase-like protein